MIARVSSHLRALVVYVFAVSLCVPTLGPGAAAATAPAPVPPTPAPVTRSAQTTHVRSADTQPVATVEMAKRDDPSVNLRDSYEVATAFDGSEAAASALANDEVESLSLAVGDFDGDGTDDLVSGHGGAGGGMVVVRRGDPDAIKPAPLDEQGRSTVGTPGDRSFVEEAAVFELPGSADFVGAGDFDADGHVDLVAASRGGRALWFLRGDGTGNLAAPTTIEVPGAVTALVAADVNRVDRLMDVVVGVVTADGPRALVFEGPEGALRREPEALAIPAPATAIAAGRLDEDGMVDVAMAAGANVVFVTGRDRQLVLNEEMRTNRAPATVQVQGFDTEVRSVAIGEFDRRPGTELAVLDGAGSVRVLGQARTRAKKRLGLLGMTKAAVVEESWPEATALVSAKVSTGRGDDLVVMDPAKQGLHVVTRPESDGEGANKSATRRSVTVSGRSDVAAVVSMRLSSDPLADLVILDRGRSAPSISKTAAGVVYTVTNTNTNGSGSFRAALQAANGNPGLDEIRFNLPGTGPWTILNDPNFDNRVTDPVLVDGWTQAGWTYNPVVELAGLPGAQAGSPVGAAGMTIDSSICTVRGLAFTLWQTYGITVKGNKDQVRNNIVIEGNFVGLDFAQVARPCSSGIYLGDNVDSITIGGGSERRNVISGNSQYGILGSEELNIFKFTRSNISILENVIGTTADGSAARPNRLAGIDLLDLKSSRIVGNLICGNGLDPSLLGAGIALDAADSVLIQGNFVGVNSSGTEIGNGTGIGVRAFERAAGTIVIGGTTSSSRNVISGNGNVGISVDGPKQIDCRVLGNRIGTDASGTLARGNGGSGISSRGRSVTVGGATPGAGNLISDNGGNGISLSGAGTAAQILGNSIGTDVTKTLDLGNAGDGIHRFNQESVSGFIGGIQPGEGNTIAFNRTGGVFSQLGNPLYSAFFTIRGNSIFSNGGSGIESSQNPDDPVLTSAEVSFTQTVVRGNLVTNYSHNATMDFYSNPACDGPEGGEGKVYLGTAVATGATFQATLPAIPPDSVVTATWTRTSGVIRGTSEFSNCVSPVLITKPTVTNTNNSGPGSLRQAIIDANGFPYTKTIYFDIPGAGVQTITPTSPLPALTAPVTIAGDTQPGFAGSPLIRLNGPNAGLSINASKCSVRGLTITGASGNGITIAGSDNVIGENGKFNAISNCAGAGVAVASGTRNSVWRNLYVGNGVLAIDLGPSGATPNDPGDADSGANDLQNAPVLTSASSTATTLTVQGTLDSTPNTTFVIAVFKNQTCIGTGPGEGLSFVGAAQITTGASGPTSLNLSLPVSGAVSGYVTATATRGTVGGAADSTSEFSPCVGVCGSGSAVVTNANDSGAGSLRQAILDASTCSAATTISFDIVAGPTTIQPLSPLPPVPSNVTIDGRTQPGYGGTNPVIKIDGSLAGGAATGLTLSGDSAKVYALNIYRFATGIKIPGSHCVVERCAIGTDALGVTALPNTLAGVEITGHVNRVGGSAAGAGNVISGNGGAGVLIMGIASTNSVLGNMIGTNRAGTAALSNGGYGVDVRAGANSVGGSAAGEGNLISGNGSGGISITHSAIGVRGNRIGTNAAGTGAVPNNGPGISVTGASNTIGGTGGAGNLVSGNTGDGIRLSDGSTTDTVIKGNRVGTNADGTAKVSNTGAGVNVQGASRTIVGGSAAGEGNLISGNYMGVILGFGASNCVVKGNKIGTGEAGMAALGNQFDGILVQDALATTIGGSAAGEGNLVGGNGRHGISLWPQTGPAAVAGSTVRGNTIGVNAALTLGFGNGQNGVYLNGASGVTIGGTGGGEANDIVGNNHNGVSVVSSTGISIRRNLIFSNGALGIDLDGDGPTPNDAGDGDGGANGRQNTPILSAVVSGGGNTQIVGQLSSTPFTSFEVEFYANTACGASGRGQGRAYLGQASLNTDNAGNAAINVSFPYHLPAGGVVTATATSAGGATSEFSACGFAAGCGGVLVVTNTSDSGNGSLRAAIESANLCSTGTTIRFDITGSGPHTIAPTSDLPALTRPIAIDATSQPGYAGTPVVVLDGVNATVANGMLHALTLQANGCVVRGLSIVRFPGAAVFIASNDNVVSKNYLGTNPSGDAGLGNGFGVRTFTGQNNTIGGPASGDGNVIVGSSKTTLDAGISIEGFFATLPSGNKIQNNRIGTVDGTTALANSNGIQVISGPNTSVIGNLVSGNTVFGVSLAGSSPGSVVTGNLIGTTAGGDAALGNGQAGLFAGGGVTVGGASAAERNVVSGNLVGIQVGGSGTVVKGNYVGTNAAGTAAIPNTRAGIDVQGQGHLIGGSAPGEGNLISGNGGAAPPHVVAGIVMTDGNNTIRGNLIGTNASGTAGIPNLGHGIALTHGLGCIVGGTGAGEANIIAYNTGDGVAVVQGSALHRIRGNRIFGNGGLGIDVDDNGVTPNDGGDVDGGSNEQQNFPVVEQVRPVAQGLLVQLSLDSAPGTTFEIDLYGNAACDASGHGEGVRYIGTVTVVTDGGGHASFGSVMQWAALPGETITATATSPSGSTSEFSACATVGCPDQDIVVLNTNDSGPGSLRNAIEVINVCQLSNQLQYRIQFQVPGSGPHTISLMSALPAVENPVVVNGLSQPGSAPGAPTVEIEGSQIDPSLQFAYGLWLKGAGSEVVGLVVNRFPRAGIRLSGDLSTVRSCFLGTDPTGSLARPNEYGLLVTSSGNAIGGQNAENRNVMSGNRIAGLLIAGPGDDDGPTGNNNLVLGNYVGTDATGTFSVGNREGVQVVDAGGNHIGVAGFGNVISGNSQAGVVLGRVVAQTSNTSIVGNIIGLDATGASALGNGREGILGGSQGLTIGDTAPGGGNVISANGLSGMFLQGTTNLTIKNNLIGTDATGMLPRGNGNEGIFLSGVTGPIFIGGALSSEGNVISGNVGKGIRLSSLNGPAIVFGNKIGTDKDGGGPGLGNGHHGIWIQSTSDALVGTGVPANWNTIAYNGWAGIAIEGATSGRNRIFGNSIHSNGHLGIDLGTDGVTANDEAEQDADSGPNGLQNAPRIVQVITVNGQTQVFGSLSSAPNTDYVIQFYADAGCDESGSGEGAEFLALRNVMTGPGGFASFNVDLPTVLPSGRTVTATAMGPFGDTSEFSTCGTTCEIVQITQPPTGATVCESGTATFTVVATGTVQSYEWRRGPTPLANGDNISGADTATLTISSVTAADAGDYYCVVTGVCTPAQPTPVATLTVTEQLSITSQPSDQAVCAGAQATFTVGATGTGLTYQWRRGETNLDDDGNISGVTSPTLTISSVSAADAGDDYNCVVSATCGTSRGTASVSLSVGGTVTIDQEPTAQSACAGGRVSFTVGATGPGLTYQWRRGTTNLTNTGNVSGADTATLTIDPVGVGDAASNYNCVVTGACGTPLASAAAALTLDTAPSVTTDPTDQGSCPGATVSFTAAASGSPAPSVQWQVDDGSGSGFQAIADATSTTLSGTAGTAPFLTGNKFRAVFTNTCDTDTSAEATLTATDTVGPVLSDCPDPVSTTSDPGACSAAVFFKAPTATDACDGARPVTCTPASGSAFPVGVTTVTCTASDASDNSNACTFTVTVTDGEAPTLDDCPDGITTPESAPGSGSATVTYSPPAATDNCGVAVACSPVSGSSFPVGTTTVTCTAMDAASNAVSCSFTVTVTTACTPPVAAAIAGATSVVAGDGDHDADALVGYTYSVPAQAGASYAWSASAGGTIWSGQGTASIQIVFDHSAGPFTVSVLIDNGCGTTTATLPVTKAHTGLWWDFLGTGTPGGWINEVGQWGQNGGAYENPAHAVTAPGGTLYESVSYGQVYGNFTVEAEIAVTRTAANAGAATTLWVRGTPTPLIAATAQRWNSGYAFNIANTGKYSIFKYTPTGNTSLQAWVAPVGTTINTIGGANRLKIVASGTTMTFYINGVAVKTLTGQTQYQTGKVGVAMVRTSASPADVLRVNFAKLSPAGFLLPKADDAMEGIVSAEQDAENDRANRREPKANPLFDRGEQVGGRP
jgi:hypothetical protein